MSRLNSYDNMSYWSCPRCRSMNMHYNFTCNLCNYSMVGYRDYNSSGAGTSTIQIGTSSPKIEEPKINKIKLLLK